jgi:S1-C subfamily serine protease
MSFGRIAGLVLVAAAGGGLALAGAAVVGDLGGTTTVQEVQNVTAPTSSQVIPTPHHGLTDTEIYRRAAPGVVQITATSTVQTSSDPFGLLPPTRETQQALGSGFVIDKAGHILTNEHVIQGASKVQVSFSGQDAIRATVVGKDPSTDVAVLKIDAHARALTPLPFGDSDAVQVGDQVVAIGNPFGYDRTLTAGVVSAVGREIASPNSSPIDNAIQTDAAINHGNSGGPLLNDAGEVIGVTSQISTGSTGEQGNIGIGFAIPSNLVRTVAAQLIKSGKVEHAFLGVTVAQLSDSLAKLFNLPTHTGLLVQDVQAGSGAAKAGIRPGKTSVIVQGNSYQLGGDIIVAVDGHPVTTYAQLRDTVSGHKPGDHLPLQVFRNGKRISVSVALGNQP